MNLLFWNLAKNDNRHDIKNIIVENDVDLSIFAEYKTTDMDSVVSDLQNEYCLYRGYGGCDKVILLARREVSTTIRREQTRYTIYSYNIGSSSFIIAGIHLPANPSANGEERKNIIRELIQDISELENEMHHSNTIIVGDFNASPFDDELIQKDAFNAVLYKQLIKSAEYVTIEGKRYRRFYNPIINYVSETSANYGSFYYGHGMNSLYWFCYDQVIVRKPLVDTITNVRYCKTIRGKSLLNKCKPKSVISDHLPLLVQFERTI